MVEAGYDAAGDDDGDNIGVEWERERQRERLGGRALISGFMSRERGFLSSKANVKAKVNPVTGPTEKGRRKQRFILRRAQRTRTFGRIYQVCPVLSCLVWSGLVWSGLVP